MRLTDPFAELDRFMRDVAGSGRGAGMMPMDVFEKDGKYFARFDLPGIDPESVELTVENQVLTVTVQREWEDTDGVNWLVRERPAGRHSRQMRLGANVDVGAIDAAYEHGVLTVTIPLREDARPRRVEIKTTAALPA